MKEVQCVDRLKNMMVIDKQESSSKINRLIKAEVLYVLKNYFDIVAEELSVSVNVGNDGKYEICIAGKCDNIKVAHLFN